MTEENKDLNHAAEKENLLTKENEVLLTKNAKMAKEFEELKEKYSQLLYTLADTRNEMQILIKQNELKLTKKIQQFSLHLIEVLDSLEIAYSLTKTEGLDLVIALIKKILADNNISEIEAKLGEKFDYKLHEITSCEKSEEFAENHIIKIEKKGYKFGTNVIRYTQVAICKY